MISIKYFPDFIVCLHGELTVEGRAEAEHSGHLLQWSRSMVMGYQRQDGSGGIDKKQLGFGCIWKKSKCQLTLTKVETQRKSPRKSNLEDAFCKANLMKIKADEGPCESIQDTFVWENGKKKFAGQL